MYCLLTIQINSLSIFFRCADKIPVPDVFWISEYIGNILLPYLSSDACLVELSADKWENGAFLGEIPYHLAS